MSTVLILAPIVAGSWPAITAAVGSAAAAMGLAIKESMKDSTRAQTKVQNKNMIEVELQDSQALADTVAAGQEIVLTKGTLSLRVHRNKQGRCVICAEGANHTEEELRATANTFSEKISQCFVYNKVMSELRTKGFQVVNEEQMEDETVRIHVRRWEG